MTGINNQRRVQSGPEAWLSPTLEVGASRSVELVLPGADAAGGLRVPFDPEDRILECTHSTVVPEQAALPCD